MATLEQQMEFSLTLEQNSGADFSNDKTHRFSLWRTWDLEKPKAMCIGLNPSNANAGRNDPTIRILIKMLMKLGYGGFYMMNCWTFVASKPELLQHNEISDKRKMFRQVKKRFTTSPFSNVTEKRTRPEQSCIN